jgi:DNA-binding CsgD family transcriptional regulator
VSVLVGRERELNTLEKALHDASQGIGCCILLTGEAGIGKSRLIEELKHKATSEKFTILQGDCFESDLSFPYAPWIDALRAFFRSLNGADIEELLGPLAPEFVKLLPELALLLPQIQPTPPLEPLAEKYRLFESFTRFGFSLSRTNPVLLILEDLHWGDELSLELVQYVVHRIDNQPLMLVGSYRNEEPSPHLAHILSKLNREALVQEIALKPFDHAEVEQMTRSLLKTQVHIPARMVDTLLALTDGNPFFVEEVLKGLAEEDNFNELWQYKSLDELHVPPSIQRMVQGRVKQLTEMTRRILITASVIGQRFDFGLLQEITVHDEEELLQALKELIGAHLVVQESPDQFAFKHALTHNAIYSMLMLRELKVLLRTVGEALERSVGMRTDVSAAQLAYHFYQGEVWQKAMEYSQRAGERAQALYAPREALSHFTHALHAAQQLDISPSPVSLRGRAQARELLGDFEGARADYETVLELAHLGENRIDEWQALIDLGLLWQSRDLKRAGEYYQRAFELAEALEDSSILGQTLNRLGNWHMNLGRAREALRYHREALVLFRERDDRHGMASTLDLLGLASYPLGEAIQGAAYLEQAVPLLRELDDRQALVNTLTNLSLRALMETEVLGEIDFVQLTNPSYEALQIARGFNWYEGESLTLIQAAIGLRQTGEYGQALERLAEAKPLVDESQNRELLARLHLTYGQTFTGLLVLTEARQHLETGLAQVQALGSGILILGATAGLASVALLQNDLARAQALLAPLLSSDYPEGQEPFPLRRCWGVRAELELRKDNPARALEVVDRLLASTPNLAEYGPHAVPYLSRLRALALADLGRMEESESELQGTIPVAQAQGQRPLLWKLYADLGSVYRTMGRRKEAADQFSFARTIIQELANSVPEGALRDHFLKEALGTIPPVPVLTRRQAAKKEYGGLTTREREIAALIARGKSNGEIADELVISEKTAERHVANILLKLGFNSRTQIAVWAVEKGLGK